MFQFILSEEELLPLPQLGRGNVQERRRAIEEFKAVAAINLKILERRNEHLQWYCQKVIGIAKLIIGSAFFLLFIHLISAVAR